MKDRFNLEDEIMALHHFVDSLGTLSEGIIEHNLNNEEVVNAIEGMRVMLTLHANKLQDTMCQCLKLDQYRGCKNACGGCVQ
jgi:hypothetical protein